MECGYTIYIAIYHGIFTLVLQSTETPARKWIYKKRSQSFVVNLPLFLIASACVDVDGSYLDRIGVGSCGEYWKLCRIGTPQVKGS